jgi:S1-C subfamily serine protease
MNKTAALLSLLLTAACQGPAGSAGAQGPMGTQGAMGSAGPQGDAGPAGPQGPTGSQGQTGSSGPAGPAGKDGKDGQSLTQTLQAVLDHVVPRQAAILKVYCSRPCTTEPGCTAGQLWDRGTGTKLADGTVLTAGHVVAGATACVLESESGVEVGRSSSTRQPVAGRDLALVSVTWNALGTALPSFDATKAYAPKLGDLVLVAGYPGGYDKDLQYTFGFVTDPVLSDAPPAWSGAVIVDYGSAAGSSGAPVFSAAGVVIGIHVGLPDGMVTDLKAFLPLVF